MKISGRLTMAGKKFPDFDTLTLDADGNKFLTRDIRSGDDANFLEFRTDVSFFPDNTATRENDTTRQRKQTREHVARRYAANVDYAI